MKNSLGKAFLGFSSLRKDIINNEEFGFAKTGDIKEADKLIERYWRNSRTDDLSEIKSDKSVLFTTPSSTQENIIPLRLAEYLGRKLKIPVVNGDQHYNIMHTQASKGIGRDKRIFSERKYEVVDIDKTSEQLRGKDVIIVDDILNSGGSVRSLSEHLEKDGFVVSMVLGLMGDNRLSLDQKTEDKLLFELKDKNINIAIERINHITRAEAGGLIRSLKNMRTQDARERFTENLRGIQSGQVVADIKGNENPGRYDSDKRGNEGNGQSSEGIPTYKSSPVQQRYITAAKERILLAVKQSESVKEERKVTTLKDVDISR